jgi:hypothetical protein
VTRFVALDDARMDELAERFAPLFREAELAKLAPVAEAEDVSPDECVGLILRSAVAALSGAVKMAVDHSGQPYLVVRNLVIEALDVALTDFIEAGRRGGGR